MQPQEAGEAPPLKPFWGYVGWALIGCLAGLLAWVALQVAVFACDELPVGRFVGSIVPHTRFLLARRHDLVGLGGLLLPAFFAGAGAVAGAIWPLAALRRRRVLGWLFAAVVVVAILSTLLMIHLALQYFFGSGFSYSP